MKILRLLNRNFFSIIFIIFVSFKAYAEDKPVDIWSIGEKTKENESISAETTKKEELKENQKSELDIYNLQSQKEIDKIELENSFGADEIKIYGLYDPEDYDLNIDMWSNSNGDQLK